jgi:hypothetical protein
MTGLPDQDDRTAKTDQPGLDCQDKTARTDCQEEMPRTARKGQPGRECQGRTAKTELPGGQDSQDIKVLKIFY